MYINYNSGKFMHAIILAVPLIHYTEVCDQNTTVTILKSFEPESQVRSKFARISQLLLRNPKLSQIL
jgi:hypothetical protein